MDTFPSSPPAAVRADLTALRASLDESGIPLKSLDRNVLIGTWNIRGFGKVLEGWDSPAGESPRRNPRDVLCLAEIVSRFDVVALQEIKRDLGGLRRRQASSWRPIKRTHEGARPLQTGPMRRVVDRPCHTTQPPTPPVLRGRGDYETG